MVDYGWVSIQCKLFLVLCLGLLYLLMNKQRRRRVNCDENEDPTSNSKPIIYESQKPKTSKVMFMEEIDYKMEIS